MNLRPSNFEAVPEFQPTPEQAEILEAFKTQEDLVIQAGAGTGKTKTLQFLGESGNRRGVYLAYNRAIADDAKGRFPSNVACSTAHSLAFRTVGRDYAARLNSPRMPARVVAERLRITEPLYLGLGGPVDEEKEIPEVQLARIVMETVSHFCNSASSQIGSGHIRAPVGMAQKHWAQLAEVVVPLAEQVWLDLMNKNDGRFKFEHDHYLKIWALSNPRIQCDFLMLDEAQDANPVLAAVVENQNHCQRVLVGDSNQAIYGWRGAIDAMEEWTGTQKFLSQSFRFGPNLAGEANKWLTLLNSELRLTGWEKLTTEVVDEESGTASNMGKPDAVLCRTNAGAIAQAIQWIGKGYTPALVGGTDVIRRLALAADSLKRGRRTEHPDLFMFKDWTEVQEYVKEDAGGGDLRVFVKMVDDYGTEMLIETVDNMADESKADIVISTAHRAKGREWKKVKVADDFRQPDEKHPMTKEDAMLAYVTVTRAKEMLDRSGLAWVDEVLASGTGWPVSG